MAVYIPNEEELYDRFMAKYASNLNVAVAELGQEIHVRCKVLAAEMASAYLSISEGQNNYYVSLAKKEELRRIGRVWLKRDIAPAEQGKYYVQVTSVDGAIINKDNVFQSNNDSTSPKKLFVSEYAYSTDGDPINDIDPLPNPTGQILIRSLDAGLESELKVGDKLTSVQPLTNVTDEVEVVGIFRSPKNEESVESYRSDLKASRQSNAKVYTASLIRLWCNEIPELRAVYVYMKRKTAGELVVMAEATKENSDVIIGQPLDEVVDKIYKYVNGFESGAIIKNEDTGDDRKDYSVINFNVGKAIARPVDILLTGLSDESKAEIIKDRINDRLYTIRPYMPAADSTSDIDDTLSVPIMLSAIYEALSGTGAIFTSLVMKVDNTEYDSFKFGYGDYPYFANLYNDGSPI